MLAASDVARSSPSSPPGSGVVPRRPSSSASGVLASKRGKISRMLSGCPSSHTSSSPNARRARRWAAAG